MCQSLSYCSPTNRAFPGWNEGYQEMKIEQLNCLYITRQKQRVVIKLGLTEADGTLVSPLSGDRQIVLQHYPIMIGNKLLRIIPPFRFQ